MKNLSKFCIYSFSFLLTVIIIFSFFRYTENSSLLADNKMETFENEDKVSKGALIEAIFVLKNRKNKLLKYKQKITDSLKEIEFSLIEIPQKKIEREKVVDFCFSKNNSQDLFKNWINDNKILFYSKKDLSSKFVKFFYKKLLEEIKIYLNDIEESVRNLDNRLLYVSSRQIKDLINRSNLVQELMFSRYNLSKLLLKTYRKNLCQWI